MRLKSKAEIQLLVNFLFRQLFSQEKWLRKEANTEARILHFISMQLHTGILLIQNSRYNSYHSSRQNNELLNLSILLLKKEYALFKVEWQAVRCLKEKDSILADKIELILLKRSDTVTDTLYGFYLALEKTINEAKT